ncbi:nitroreductase family deazaflavin-dependent oxidoreductase [Thermocrispum municipale]|jgi:deazaflavin-dependent oxidoreductase (nitroreductase family)|uniref:nitroreductase family deazaflavin-dependent oxidoreductase n=1 Tax=Thermocrispum municipale TaxID=37926 RepID=UPI0004058DE6|nr:nitroreductase family deazaflavin-dependent oxidoreductase [Thermocrispum municipale]
MGLTDHKPRGILRLLLRAPIWLYRAGLGWLFGRRLLYVAHRGRRTGARREVVVEVVDYRPDVPEVVVVAAWGKNPDWYRNLQASPALEIRLGRQRWTSPEHRRLEPAEVLEVLHNYQRKHPRAWKRLAPLLGFPTDPDDPRWPDVAAGVRSLAFRPNQPGSRS